MSQPQDVKAADVPVARDDDGTEVRVVCGAYQGIRGPVDDVAARPVYLDVSVPAGRRKALPVETTAGEVAIARNVLTKAASAAGVQMLDLGAAVVFEDRFNRMVAATRSKASTSFTFVASHLACIWERYGEHHPIVAVDRQSGRMRYRELLAQCFPTASITVLVSDFLLVHGNGVSKPERIAEMVRQTRKVPGYHPVPILFNEDDHFDFDKPQNNFRAAVSEYASWGYFDFRMKGEGFDEGYQSVPVNWGISSERKRGFFRLLKEIVGE